MKPENTGQKEITSACNLFWFLLNSAAGTMTVLALSMLLTRLAREGKRPFSTATVNFIGQHTLGIFLLHKTCCKC